MRASRHQRSNRRPEVTLGADEPVVEGFDGVVVEQADAPDPRLHRAQPVRGTARLRARNAWWASHSPSTSAWRMNNCACGGRVDAVVGDGAPADDRQPVQRDRLGRRPPRRDGRPTAARRSERLHEVGAGPLRPLRLIVATRRAHRRSVSTSSAAITHPAGFRGQHRAGGDRRTTRRGRRGTGGRRASRIPMCDSSPARTARWTWSGCPVVRCRACTPSSPATWRSWLNRSCHSRTRR